MLFDLSKENCICPILQSECVNVRLIFREQGSSFHLTRILVWCDDLTGKAEVQPAPDFFFFFAVWTCFFSRLQATLSEKAVWTWGTVRYLVSMAHPGRYDFKKSKATYQYSLNLISSFNSNSCKVEIWRTSQDLWNKHIYSDLAYADFLFKIILHVCSGC